MKKYKTYASTTTFVEQMSCDLCGISTDSGTWAGDDTYEVNEVTITHRDGYSYPENGYGNLAAVDLCPKCFTEKLIPWLEAQGCIVQNSDWEY